MSGLTVDIIIPVFNRMGLTKACLNSIRDKSRTPYNLILVDNASDEETKRFLEDFSAPSSGGFAFGEKGGSAFGGNPSGINVTVIPNDHNVGWVQAVNQGMKLSKSPYICIMNNDTIVRTNDWLSGLIRLAELAPDIGLVNPYFKAKERTAQDAPFIEVDFCRGYCILIKRAVMDKVGLLDESYGLGYYDDDDYSVRAIRAGFRCVRANDVFVEHLGDSTFTLLFKDEKRRILHEKNKRLFYSKWGKRLKIVLIVTKDIDKKIMTDLLFSLARRQHIIYLWSRKPSFDLRHINIRQRRFPGFFSTLFFSLALCLNMIKKRVKQYNIVFVDDQQLASLYSKLRPCAYYTDMAKDIDNLNAVVNSAAKA